MIFTMKQKCDSASWYGNSHTAHSNKEQDYGLQNRKVTTCGFCRERAPLYRFHANKTFCLQTVHSSPTAVFIYNVLPGGWDVWRSKALFKQMLLSLS